MSTLQALVEIIANGVATIHAECDSRNAPFPSLDEPFSPESDAIRQDVYLHAIPVIAAAHQLIASLQHPSVYATSAALAYQNATCMETIVSGNVPEILREAGESGLHVDAIAAQNHMDPVKLSRVLRMLANEHIFKEVSPNVFRHNRISSILDTGNSVEFLQHNPNEKFKTAAGVSALIGLLGDEPMKSAAYVPETLLDPRTARSDEPSHAGFNRAFQTDLGFFQWYGQPGNEFRHARFNTAMTNSTILARSILQGLDWAALPEGSVVVDVGGGVGTTIMTLSDTHHHLRYVVQDLPPTAEQGTKVWEAEHPDALETGLVQIQPHDFFQPQPVKNASVFIVRGVLHNWSDTYATKIIRQLRDAATSDTKLLVVDHIIRYTCSDEGEFEDIPGAAVTDAPAPLLANYGIGSGIEYKLDLQMLTLVNAPERTLRQFVDLFRAGGWKLERVARSDGEQMQHLIASPM
ncbi:hypothetical protein CERSUDRAFT_151553 [Gelatoporia subvermispora B]|uniref:O-methyltransferase C-terminal domain-containing protein n=1 Tax=Ceriporiopsis subvermispora (strain B) TaxID=914234 RepID=M2RK56_CERS8|nr:hypothetical protein CERSUDRAFT_151553 [Gelatoporia subvermispora B]